MKNKLKIMVAAVGMAATVPAMALDMTNWSVKVGINKITPKVKSDDMTAPSLPGTKVDVGSNTQPIFSFIYNYDSKVSAELVLGTPYTHDVYGAGSINGVGKTGSVKSMPPTVFGQYHFLDTQSPVRPYVGMGVTYAYFYGETGSAALTALTNTGSSTPTTFTVDSAWGASPQIGLVYQIDEKWFADLVVVKTFLKTKAHFSTGQTINMRLDPLAVSLSLGYRF